MTRLPDTVAAGAEAVCTKAGGLADIAASLAAWAAADGRFELHIAMPLSARRVRDEVGLSMLELARLVRSLAEAGVHLVRSSAFEAGGVYDDTDLHCGTSRSIAFQASIVRLLDELEPDLVHAHDWMTGLIPAAARVRGIPSVFTLHNVYTRQEQLSELFRSGLDVTEFMRELYFTRWPEFAGDAWRDNFADLAASGVFAATAVTVVSPGFLHELLSGCGDLPASRELRGAVRHRFAAGAVTGVLNAPREDADPALSPHITPYTSANLLNGKSINKQALQQALGLAVDPRRPLFLWPNRLVAQKGHDLLLEAIAPAVERLGAQLAIVGDGETHVIASLERLERRLRGAVARRPFRASLGDLGLAGADFLLMPSRYEPCGLPQMEGPRFGTLPVVRRTGGLSDTVEELDAIRGVGGGFTFGLPQSEDLLDAMGRAAAFFHMPYHQRRRNLVRIQAEALERFHSRHCREAYMSLYQHLVPPRVAGRDRAAAEIPAQVRQAG